MEPQKPPLKLVPDRRREPRERRRSLRVECQVPVVVKWVVKGRPPQEEATETKIINAHGCLLTLKAAVSEQMNVELVNPETQEVHKGRVVWCGGVDPQGRTQVAVELENPDPKFWGQAYADFLLSAAMKEHWVG
ncbi:MAG: hypothetical protein ACE5H2_00020 [Terriglobia bacterium]